jgi:hypothetical protein
MATRLPADMYADDVADAAARINHHQLTVLAADVADVVRSAGGWLYDQARAGWDVTVWTPDECDPRPLTILGVRAVDGGTIPGDVPDTGALMVTAGLLRVDADLRTQVLAAVKRGGSDVSIMGDWPDELGAPIEPVDHQLSVAARAFKASAMSAVDEADDADAVETMFPLRTDAFRPLYPV